MYGSAVTVVTRLYRTEALAVLPVDTVVVETAMLLKCRQDNNYIRCFQYDG